MGTGTIPTHIDPGVTAPLANIGTNIERSIPTTDPNNMMDQWQQMYNTANETYRENINSLRSTIGGYETRLGNMSTQLTNLGNEYRNRESEQEKFKADDAEYVRGGSARGVRLRRSKAFESGAYAQGTSRLNRRNRMKAKGVNL